MNAVEFARVCEQAGASAIAVQGRTRVQMYAGKAAWAIITVKGILDNDFYIGTFRQANYTRAKITGTDVAKSMRGMFSKCKSLLTLPPIDVKGIEDGLALKDFIYGTKVETLYLVNASETLKSQLTPKLLGNMRLKIVYQ